MVISLRLKDDLIAEIDRVAAAHGQTRSAWIAQILTRTVLASEHDDLPIAGAAGRLDHEGHSDEQVRVTVRLNRREIEAIDIVGAPLG
ncbi:hypothetical protein DC431_18370, partial [Sphingomonas melonis]